IESVSRRRGAVHPLPARRSSDLGLSGVAGEGFAGAAVPPPAEVAADGAVSGAPAPAPGSAGLSTLSSVPAAQRRVIHTAYVTLRSEEHTSELQSREKLVCRLLLE